MAMAGPMALGSDAFVMIRAVEIRTPTTLVITLYCWLIRHFSKRFDPCSLLWCAMLGMTKNRNTQSIEKISRNIRRDPQYSMAKIRTTAISIVAKRSLMMVTVGPILFLVGKRVLKL